MKQLIQQKVKKYELAVKFKQAGYFKVAYPMFRECLEDNDLDYGNILFECGWCVEHLDDVDNSLAVSYYLRAGKESADSLCRMNSFFRAGWLLMHFNRNEQAIEAFKNASRQDTQKVITNQFTRNHCTGAQFVLNQKIDIWMQFICTVQYRISLYF